MFKSDRSVDYEKARAQMVEQQFMARGISDERWHTLVRAAVTDFRRDLPDDMAQRRPDLVQENSTDEA